MTTKICNNCKIIKPVTEFHTKAGHNGQRRYNYLCKTCQSERSKEKNKIAKESTKIKVEWQKCNKCKQVKKAKCFWVDNHQKTGLSRYCNICHSKYYLDNKERIDKSNSASQRKNKTKSNLRKIKWALENKEKVKKANHEYYVKNFDKIKKWQAAHRRNNILLNRNIAHRYRARKKSATIQHFTKQQLEERMSVFGFRCAYCAGPFEHIDHVKSLSKGGYHCLSNLRPACKKCNLEKAAKPLIEFIKTKRY